MAPRAFLQVLLVGAVLAPGWGCAVEEPSQRPLTVFAAASLEDAVTEVARSFTRRTGVPVESHFAASSTLARQVEAGAPADVFLSAGPGPMERARRAGAMVPGSVHSFLSNRLVVVVPGVEDGEPRAGRIATPADLLSFERLALADPQGVPAGRYARAWLQAEGLWQSLEPRVVPALDVRAALAAVASGNVPVGVVYATDAASTDRVRVVYRVPADRGETIDYRAARVADRDHPAAERFLAYLGGGGAEIFLRHGFLLVEGRGAEEAAGGAAGP